MSTDGQQMEPFSAAVNAEARALGPPPPGPAEVVNHSDPTGTISGQAEL